MPEIPWIQCPKMLASLRFLKISYHHRRKSLLSPRKWETGNSMILRSSLRKVELTRIQRLMVQRHHQQISLTRSGIRLGTWSNTSIQSRKCSIASWEIGRRTSSGIMQARKPVPSWILLKTIMRTESRLHSSMSSIVSTSRTQAPDTQYQGCNLSNMILWMPPSPLSVDKHRICIERTVR
jgi:hypothetical protein